MVRFLLAAAAVFALFSVGFGFFNRSKLGNLSQQLGDALQRTQQSQDRVKDLQVTLKNTEERLTTQENLTQQERDNRNGELNATKAKLNQVTDQLNARDSENKALTAALAEAGRNLDQKQQAENDRQALASRLVSVEDELNQLRLLSRGKTKAPVQLEGSILSMNRDARALTVSLGTDVGVTTNTRLTLVKKGEKPIQLRVVSVDSGSSVAEFVSSAAENFAKVSVGDSVILTTR
jgi:septal ring factor EnvC (AmiA/AmiB activator)